MNDTLQVEPQEPVTVTPDTTLISPAVRAEIISMAQTFLSDFGYELLTGLALYAKTGNFTVAAASSAGLSIFRSAFKFAWNRVVALILKQQSA